MPNCGGYSFSRFVNRRKHIYTISFWSRALSANKCSKFQVSSTLTKSFPAQLIPDLSSESLKYRKNLCTLSDEDPLIYNEFKSIFNMDIYIAFIWIYGRKGERMDLQTAGQTDRRTDERTDRKTDIRTTTTQKPIYSALREWSLKSSFLRSHIFFAYANRRLRISQP